MTELVWRGKYLDGQRVGPSREATPLRLRERHGEPSGEPNLLIEGDRCAALEGKIGEKVGCAIYDERPNVCRAFEVGNTLCRSFRKERGIID